MERLRAVWPEVRIIVRADSGFCRWKMLHWCKWAGVEYIIGLARNARLETLGAPRMAEAAAAYAQQPAKQRRFGWIDYAAGTWDQERRVIAKAELSERGENPRFVVTNLEGDPQALYEVQFGISDVLSPSSTWRGAPRRSVRLLARNKATRAKSVTLKLLHWRESGSVHPP